MTSPSFRPVALFVLLLSVCLLAGCAEPGSATTDAPSPTPLRDPEPAITAPPPATSALTTTTPSPAPAATPATGLPQPTTTTTASPLAPTSHPPLPALRVERAFPNLAFPRLTNLVQPEGAPELFFASEQAGIVRVFPNDPDAAEASVFLDIRDRVSEDNNEEGLLGLAFDPEYAANGHLYVYYSAASPRRSVLSSIHRQREQPSRRRHGQRAHRNGDTTALR